MMKNGQQMMLAWCLLAGLSAWGQEPAPVKDAKLLSVDRIFGRHEFGAQGAPHFHWSKKSPHYFTFKPAADGKGSDLVRVDPATNATEVVAPASAFIQPGTDKPVAIHGFEFSDDESKLLIFTNSQRVWRRNTRGDFWVLDIAARKLSKLGGSVAPSSMMFAKFSPDASKIAFVYRNNLYVQDVSTLTVSQMTSDGSESIVNGTSDWVNEEELELRDCFRWSANGQQLLFWQFDTSGVPVFTMINNTDAKYPKLTSFPYPKVGEQNSATRLGVVSVASGAPSVKWINLPGDPREHYLPHADWRNDGSIVIQQMNRLQSENRVYVANAETGVARLAFTEKDAAWLENENPFRWLEQQKSLLWLSERSGWRHAYRVSLEDGSTKPITQGEYDVVTTETVDEKGGVLYFIASPQNATQRYLYRAKLDGSAPAERVSPADKNGTHDYTISPDGKYAVHTYSNITTPPVVQLINLADHSTVRSLADNAPLRAKLQQLQPIVPEFVQTNLPDGTKLDGWLMKPANLDPSKKYPLLIHVYGEPFSSTVRDSWMGQFGLWHAMLAQQGIAVASFDNRGTNIPRGRAWRKSVHRQIGILASKDQSEAVQDLMKKHSFIDPSRVGIWGWSGGGSMSLNAIFRYPDIYSTAIAVASVPDQTLYDTIYQERYMGLPSNNANGLREGSPITHAHKLKGNLLIVHGTGDDNCHYQGTERLVNELIARGKMFDVMPYPNRSHGISEGPNTTPHLFSTMTRYLQKHLLNSARTQAATSDKSTTSMTSPAKSLPAASETRQMQGWTVHVNQRLLAGQAKETALALKLLDQQLREIIKLVPKRAVVELQKVPLYFNPTYKGVRPTAEFHPDAGWLRANGRNPAMAGGVEFTNIAIFAAECDRMPNFVLHELAHAFHHRILPGGFGHPEIRSAFDRAKKSGSYARVTRRLSSTKPTTTEPAYALTSPMEYFAESTEAYFGQNDFFPFNRSELEQHDPEMCKLVASLWTSSL